MKSSRPRDKLKETTQDEKAMEKDQDEHQTNLTDLNLLLLN